MNLYTWLAHVLSAVGAINWGLVAFLNFNFVESLAQATGLPMVDKVLYAAFALAGLYSFALMMMCLPK